MTTPLTFSGAPVPTASELPDWPASLLAFGNGLDQLVVLKATSQSNRDTLYANVNAGTLVSCAALQTVWMKVTTPPTAAAWITLAELGTEVTSGVITAGTNFSVSSQWAQRINGIVFWRATLSYSGTTITAGANGDLSPDITVGTLQSAYLPNISGSWQVPIQCSQTTGVGHVSTGGSVVVTSLVSGGSIASGNVVNVSTSFPGV